MDVKTNDIDTIIAGVFVPLLRFAVCSLLSQYCELIDTLLRRMHGIFQVARSHLNREACMPVQMMELARQLLMKLSTY
jgi:hypothetical protein